MKKSHLNHIISMAALFVLPFSLTASHRPPETSAASDTAQTQDLILVFSRASEESERSALLSGLPDESILWKEQDTALIQVPAATADGWLSFFRRSSCVAAADYDGTIQLSSISEDAYSDAQWGLNNNGTYSYIADMNTSTVLSVVDVDMNVLETWAAYQDFVTSPREVVVAVIDTGIDVNHPDLASNIWINNSEIPGDGIDNDNNGYVDDIYGWDFYNGDNTVCHYDEDGIHTLLTDNDDHGTHVAGIIAAEKDNGVGIAGVASCTNVKIMVLKIHGGKNGSGTISNAIRAIRYATAMGADICNISWGTSKSNDALEQVIRESDMLFVTAAGNSGTNNNSSPVYPASYALDNLISVTFIDASGRMSAKSNYGISTVDLAAPGIHIYSTCVGGYCSFSGSSMAAPHVSGVAALLYSYGNNLYPSNIKEIIVNTIKPLDSLSGKVKYAGIPDAFAAITAVSSIKKDYTAPTLTFQCGFENEHILLTVNASDTGGSGVRTIRYAYGTRELSYFRHGTIEASIASGTTLSLTKAGTYTFYVSDYAGNERALIYHVLDDLTPPSAELSYKVAFNYGSITITVKASDTQSGIKTIKYAPGEQDVDYFRSGSAGTPITLKDGTGTFNVKEAGIYTVYVADYRGNKAVYTINAEIKASADLALNAYRKTVKVGKTYKIVPALTPADSTDILRFRSSDTTVCKVNTAGKVTGIAPGKATITVTTASGITRKCIITVIE